MVLKYFLLMLINQKILNYTLHDSQDQIWVNVTLS